VEKNDNLKTKRISEEGVAVVREGFNRGSDGIPLRTSALICTKDRSDMLPKAVESVLNASKTIMELIVVDQSTDDRSKNSLAPYMSDPRLVYVPDSRVGKGLALNTGLRIAQGDIVAMTDDDCIVPEIWPEQLIEPFKHHSNLAITFGNVRAADYDTTKGFTPIFEIFHDEYIKKSWKMIAQSGIGANMAVQRQKILSFGGFDPELGPGGEFKACIDYDVALRCLLFGYEVYKVKSSYIVHYGFRDWDDSKKLVRNAYYGTGASYIKPIRCGKLKALPTYFGEFMLHTVFYSITRLLLWRKPFGLMRSVYFIKGSLYGWRHPIDPRTLTYVPQREVGPEPSIQKMRA